MSINRLDNSQSPEPQFSPASLAELRFQLGERILNEPLENVVGLFNELPFDILKDLGNWNVPFQLLINGETDKLSLLFSFGLQTSVSSELFSDNGPWMTKLSLLAIAVLEENEEAVQLILNEMPDDDLEEQYSEVFDRIGNQPLSVTNIRRGLKVYDPQRFSQTLKQYTPTINAERLAEVFENSEPANIEDEESTLSVYQLAKICNSPDWVINLLEEYDCAYGDVWFEAATYSNPMIPADQYV